MASKKKARKTKPASNLLKVKEAKTTAANDKAPIPETKAKEHVTIAKAKGRPMLSWVGKRPLNAVTAFPAQHIESFAAPDADKIPVADMAIWKDWPEKYPRGGLLFHGDNKEVLAHLLANGFRGKVDLIYIDPPFDSGADYARKVTIRGAKGTAEIDGEGYTLGEQIQYTDIWANDNYLQFMYERLLLLRELLAPNGSIWLHCDWHKSHHLRSLMDEVFGPDSLRNEVIWQRTDPHNDAISRLGWVHDTLYWYGKGEETIYNWKAVVEPLSEAALREYSLIKLQDGTVVPYSQELEGKGRRFKLDDCTYKGTDPTRRFEWRGAKPSDKRVWPHNPEGMDAAVARGEFFLRDPNRGTARCRVSFLDERPGQVLQTIWTECGRMKGGVEYPTEKPQALLARIIQASSNFGGLVLDCFVGSGTTVAAAQLLGRRWIACDINKGAIQAVNKRLQDIIFKQKEEIKKNLLDGIQGDLLKAGDQSEKPPVSAQLGFTTWRVNDYDLAIQHNEAVNLACEHIGVTRTLADAFFDGTLGSKLVKIIPFGHPLSPADLGDVKRELDARANESRDVVVVCLGKELSVDAWLAEWNRMRKQGDTPNKIEVIELRSDPKYGKFIAHKPTQARVEIRRVKDRESDKLVVEVKDFISPAITERLQAQTDLLSPKISDWRAMVDSVMVDTAYDGKVFNIALADVPERKQDYVKGRYELSAPTAKTTVAVKVTDMLGEEVIVTATV